MSGKRNHSKWGCSKCKGPVMRMCWQFSDKVEHSVALQLEWCCWPSWLQSTKGWTLLTFASILCLIPLCSSSLMNMHVSILSLILSQFCCWRDMALHLCIHQQIPPPIQIADWSPYPIAHLATIYKFSGTHNSPKHITFPMVTEFSNN